MEEGRDVNSIPFDCRALYNCGNFIADINFPHKMFFRTKNFSFNRRFLNRKFTFSGDGRREKEVGNQ